MPAWLLPVLAGLGGAIVGGKKTRDQNKQADYSVDQARRDYDAQRIVMEEKDARRGDSIEFLKAVAKAKGYNIPDAAFALLNQRGPFKMPSAKDRIAAPPKSSAWLNALFSGVGSGLQAYGQMSGSQMAAGGGAAGPMNGAFGGAGSAIGGAGSLAGPAVPPYEYDWTS